MSLTSPSEAFCSEKQNQDDDLNCAKEDTIIFCRQHQKSGTICSYVILSTPQSTVHLMATLS